MAGAARCDAQASEGAVPLIGPVLVLTEFA